MRKSFGTTLFTTLAVVGLLSTTACSDQQNPTYKLEVVVPGSAFHGIHGLTFTADGTLLAGSVVGRSIYEVNVETGETSVYIGAPFGMADDLEEGPNGSLGWTAFLEGKYYLRKPNGEILTLAEGLPGLNSTAWNAEGRLFATQVFMGDALYELDPSGVNPPRKIMEDIGGLNGFDFGPDGKLYGPLWFKASIARIDVDTAELEIIADGFGIPAAVNFDSKGNLWVVDTARGEIVRVNIATGEKTIVARVDPSVDNLAFDSDDRLFITNMADNAIIEINTETGEATPIVTGKLAIAGDIAFTRNADGTETLYIADLFSFRKLDIATGDLSEIGRAWGSNIDYPFSVGVNGDDIALAGWSAGMVQHFNPQTEELGTIHHGFSAPVDALPLPNGGLLIAEFGRGALTRLEADGTTRTDITTGLAGPTSLLAIAEGKVLVSENLSGVIAEIDLNTGTRTVIAQGLSRPEGFDRDSDGILYVAEVGERRIVAINPDDGTKTILATDLPIGLEGPASGPPVYVPTGIAVSNAGDIYFSSDI